MDKELLEKISREDKLITINDARAVYRGCIPGWQRFAEIHGFDWKYLIRHGILASELAATNDAMAEKLIRWKYER